MNRLVSIVLASALAAGSAMAQTGDAGWPDRPIRLIVPFPAGSSTDIVARIIGQKLGPRVGQQIVIENRAGASGNIGADAVAKAVPDGYTIGIATASTHAVAASLSANLPYDPIKDFAPVGMIGSQPYVLVLYPGLPARNLAELSRSPRPSPARSTTARRASPRSPISPPRCSRAWPASTSPTCPTRARRNP